MEAAVVTDMLKLSPAFGVMFYLMLRLLTMVKEKDQVIDGLMKAVIDQANARVLDAQGRKP